MGRETLLNVKNPNDSRFIEEEIFPTILENVGKNRTKVLRDIQMEIRKFATKNDNVLQTNILGKQLLFNKSTESAVLSTLGVTHEMVKNAINGSIYFEQFKDLQMKDQLSYAIPLLFLVKILTDDRKIDDAKFIYMTLFFKPYASVIFKYFRYPVNPDQMLYTVENTLSDKYDIRRIGTLIGTIEKIAENSYDNYIKELTTSPTDANLHIIFNSGIYSRINNMMRGIFDIYSKNKGKYLAYEASSVAITDDEGEDEIANDIKSDIAIKDGYAKRAIQTLNISPVNTKYARLSAAFGFPVQAGKGPSEYYTGLVAKCIDEISDKKMKEIPLFIESILNSFIYGINPSTGKKFLASDIKTPVFLEGCRKIFKMQNVKDPNIVRVKEMLNRFLEECSYEYNSFSSSNRQYFKKAILFYFTLLIQKS